MVSHGSFSNKKNMVLFFLVFCCFLAKNVSSFEYQVGGKSGWVVPPKNDTRMFNDWASKNRFTVGDSLHFWYKKDSVLEVSNDEYKKCDSTHPHFFSNSGNTEFNLNRSGSFYFISGAMGHCSLGQHMIVRVLEDEDSRSNGGRSSSPGPVAAVVVLVYGIISQYAFSYFY